MARTQAALNRQLAPARRDSHENGFEHERVADIQRARILTAMTEVVAERGVANVTVAHIVARSGVSRRTFYELFTDRNGCLLATLDDAIQRIAASVVPAYQQASKWSEQIRAGLIALLDILDMDPDTGHLLIIESLGAGPDALRRRDHVLSLVVNAVEEGRREAKKSKGPPPLAAEGVVGGVLSVLHSRLVARKRGSLLGLTGPLMGVIVLPYLGRAAAENELQRPVPSSQTDTRPSATDPLRDLEMRLTYRTVRVLTSIAAHPGSSNREVAMVSGIQDQGQISKLMTRLDKLGLVQNTGVGSAKGAPNAWTLTHRGHEVEQAIGMHGGRGEA